MTDESVPNRQQEVQQILAKICDRALAKQDYETDKDVDIALKLFRRLSDSEK